MLVFLHLHENEINNNFVTSLFIRQGKWVNTNGDLLLNSH